VLPLLEKNMNRCRILFLCIACLFMGTAPGFAQRNALIEHDDSWNLFSKFTLGVTEIDGDTALQGGLAVGGLLENRFGIGLAARTLLDSVETESPLLQDIENTDFWYGGLYSEYQFTPTSLVNMSLDMTIGAGRLEVNRTAGGSEQANVFVVEPGVNMMVNVTETFHLGLGLHYRYVHNVSVRDLEESDMSGVTGSIFLRFTEY
jgi:hypothetical protein